MGTSDIINDISDMLFEQKFDLVNYFGERLFEWLEGGPEAGPVILYAPSSHLQEDFLDVFMDSYSEVSAHVYFTKTSEDECGIYLIILSKLPVEYVGVGGRMFNNDEHDELVQIMSNFIEDEF